MKKSGYCDARQAGDESPIKCLGVGRKEETTMTVESVLQMFGGSVLVIDPVTDAVETAASCTVRPVMIRTLDPLALVITDPTLIRALYDDPRGVSYGDGSYTVEPT